MDGGELPELPAPDPEQEPEQITLLLLVKLLHVLIRTHGEAYISNTVVGLEVANNQVMVSENMYMG